MNSGACPSLREPFATELRRIILAFADRIVTLREILQAIGGRGYNLLLIALPLTTPIPLPGFSVPFGSVFILVGPRLALAQKPWLPEMLLRRPISARALRKTF